MRQILIKQFWSLLKTENSYTSALPFEEGTASSKQENNFVPIRDGLKTWAFLLAVHNSTGLSLAQDDHLAVVITPSSSKKK